MITDKTTVRREKIDPTRWHELKNILADALELPSAAARAALVESRCANDATLLAEAELLVREAQALLNNPTDPLEDCAEHATVALWQDESRIGWRIGAYRVTRELGRGGMGTVYLAARADGQFEKEVAIKVLKRGTDTEEVLQRFAAERHILAQLDHPNIARLLDAGTTDDGLPYFVMELVSGSPVTRYVREHELPMEERLGIILKICAAVEVAHQNHVIHRDLKPSNILVNAKGEPKLLDFGIAKLLTPASDAVELTAAGQQCLTPICASPEQTDGRSVNETSDVYALGALCYEILTDRRPYKFTSARPSRDEIALAVREQEPIVPSRNVSDPAKARLLLGDLDAILMKAIRKEPDTRYATVADFAADIRRHLAREPAFARAEKRSGGATTFLRRSRVARVIATAVAVLIIAGLLLAVRSRFFQKAGSSTAASARNETAGASDLEKSIAVLPFQNLSSDPDGSFFADGIQDSILSDLAKVADLKVISRSSVSQYTLDRPRNVREISGQLSVAHFLEGSVQREGNQVRVTARLIDTRTGAQEWADTYQRELANIFDLQSDLAQAIVAQLQAKILPEEKAKIEQPVTRDLVAYDLFRRASQIVDSHLDQQDVRGSLLRAANLLEQATARDPKFTLAYCYAARAHNLLVGLSLDLSSARVRLAENAFNAALRLDPNSAEAHLAKADYYFRCYLDLARASAELDLARAGLPNSTPFYVVAGNVHRRQGRWAESEREFAKAVALDPRNPNAVNYLADTQILMRQFSEAIRTYEGAALAGLDSPVLRIRIAVIKFAATGDAEALRAALAAAPPELDVGGGETPLRILVALLQHDDKGAAAALAASPRVDFQDVDFSFYYPRGWYEATIARAAGDHTAELMALAAARSVLEERLKTMPLNRNYSVLAQIYAGLGLKELAIRTAQGAVERMPSSRDAYEGPLVLQALAQVYVRIGENDRALDLVEQLMREPGYLSYGYLAADPAWEPLRAERRFQELLVSIAPPSAR